MAEQYSYALNRKKQRFIQINIKRDTAHARYTNIRDGGMIRAGTVEEAYEVFLSVPELDQYLSLQEMKERLCGEHHIIVAEIDHILVGFKIGYLKDNAEFYSWLGGVLPKYRQTGVAQKLLLFQENWVRKLGVKSISVKSMNRFPSMLRMLIKNGYKIQGVEFYGDSEKERINFVKQL